MCLRYGFGARITLADSLGGGDPFVALFSESAGRAVVSVPAGNEERLAELCSGAEVPLQRIGTVSSAGTGSTAVLEVEGIFALPLERLRSAHEGTLPALLGALAPTGTDAA